MQCDEFEDRLNRLLDHRLLPHDDAALVAHADDCEACASLLQGQQLLFAGLRASRPEPPVTLAARVVSEQHFASQRRRGNWRNVGWAFVLATAASVLGLAAIAMQNRTPAVPVVKESAAPVKSNGSGLAIGHLGPTKPAPAEATVSSESADRRLDEYFTALESLATQIGDSAELDEVSETLTPTIRPIQSSFGLAIDALRRTLPRGKEHRSNKPEAGAHVATEPAIVG